MFFTPYSNSFSLWVYARWLSRSAGTLWASGHAVVSLCLKRSTSGHTVSYWFDITDLTLNKFWKFLSSNQFRLRECLQTKFGLPFLRYETVRCNSKVAWDESAGIEEKPEDLKKVQVFLHGTHLLIKSMFRFAIITDPMSNCWSVRAATTEAI